MNSVSERKWLTDEDRKSLQNLRLLDDDFMRMVFTDDLEATALLLNVFFERNDMVVLEAKSQLEIKNPSGRSVRLDIYAVDSEGKHYDIEIQKQDKGAGVRRARFNSSLLDSRLLESGQDTEALPDSYVIFITENDIRGGGRPIYRFYRTDSETHELLNDGSHIIYVNGSYKNDGSPIGMLMHDFRCTSATDMNNKVLAEKVRYFKEESEGGHENMCKIVEDITKRVATEAKALGLEEGMGIGMEKGMGIGMEKGMGIGMEKGMGIGMEKGMGIGMEKGMKKGMEKGMGIGKKEAQQKFAVALLKKGGMSLAEIAELTTLSVDDVKKLSENSVI